MWDPRDLTRYSLLTEDSGRLIATPVSQVAEQLGFRSTHRRTLKHDDGTRTACRMLKKAVQQGRSR